MTPSPPPSLVRYLREKRCVLFCGSGVSASAGLPTWKQLLTNIVEQLAQEDPDDPNQEELRRLIGSGKLLEVADHCKDRLGRLYNDALSENLRDAGNAVPELHRIITQLPFASVVTTNYDKLLERAYASVGDLPKTPTHRDLDALGPLLFNGGFFVLKAHGDIDRPDSMVLTTRDYQEIIHANPSFNAVFSALLLTKAVLFVGYSLNDPDFRLLLDRQLTVFRGHVPERFALMTGLGKVEREVLWRTARIRVIPYDEGHHEQVQEFLSSLLAEVGTKEAELASAPLPEAASRGRPKPAALGVSPPPQKLKQPSVPEPAEPAVPEQAACVLSIRLRGPAIDASLEWSGGFFQSLGAELDRPALTALMRQALRDEEGARRFGQELASRLPSTISEALSQVPKGQTISLRLAAEIDLLPWELTTIGGDFLLLRNPVVRMAGVSNAARGYPNLRGNVRVLLIGDPNRNDDLPLEAAEQEIKAIAKIYEGHKRFETLTLLGPEATFDTVASGLASGTFDIIHFAGHAWFDDLEPFLLLSGQVKLRATEMRSLLSMRPPAVLFLNTHYSIFLPPGASGEVPPGVIRDLSEPSANSATVVHGQRGFIEAAGTAGVGTLIGSYSGNLDDVTAQHVGAGFHAEFLSGKTVAQALHDALNRAFSSPDAQRASCLTYAMSGYGDLKVSRA
ncbi:SIR2 family protein [Bradyrhizobium sp. 21]|uniref:SIR2 family protein n=1 Tax=Bradyrhizobium sp. 21 TaxID=2782666 RepID=UPI001FFBA2F1|nr:SIR2 family protein [Bradyrhizobium sp. 21]MCK1388895.1 SIR2 family protein [Bradyrhizobium sp. 21]